MSDWMGQAPLPRPTSQASATSSGNMVVAPTDNTKLYCDYLNGNPKRAVPHQGCAPDFGCSALR